MNSYANIVSRKPQTAVTCEKSFVRFPSSFSIWESTEWSITKQYFGILFPVWIMLLFSHVLWVRTQKRYKVFVLFFNFRFFSNISHIRILRSTDLCSAYSQFWLYAPITTRKKINECNWNGDDAASWHMTYFNENLKKSKSKNRKIDLIYANRRFHILLRYTYTVTVPSLDDLR